MKKGKSTKRLNAKCVTKWKDHFFAFFFELKKEIFVSQLIRFRGYKKWQINSMAYTYASGNSWARLVLNSSFFRMKIRENLHHNKHLIFHHKWIINWSFRLRRRRLSFLHALRALILILIFKSFLLFSQIWFTACWNLSKEVRMGGRANAFTRRSTNWRRLFASHSIGNHWFWWWRLGMSSDGQWFYNTRCIN